jgi:hypothetical protein
MELRSVVIHLDKNDLKQTVNLVYGMHEVY